MKILLFGEYSGVHTNLKEGLVELGHQVVTASTGDGSRKIESDINWNRFRGEKKSRIESFIHLMRNFPKLYGFDVVQFMYPFVFNRGLLGIDTSLAKKIFKENGKVFLVGGGCNQEITAKFLENKFKYPQLYREINRDIKKKIISRLIGRPGIDSFFLKNIDGYIPLMYEYAQGFRDVGYKKLCPTIPIPMNINNIQFSENIPNQKIFFFHGLTRSNVKGTPLISKAMENLKRKYPNDIEIAIKGGMPLKNYLKFLDRVNVVIDQAYSASYGANVVYNLALGKIVVGGGEEECKKEFSISDCPIIPIRPTVNDIEKKLENILENRKDIPMMGHSSRKYAEKIHNHTNIAEKYVNVWTK